MLIVPPVLSRVIPIKAPKIIRNPIEAIVLPKPSLIVVITVAAGSVVKARNSETIKRAINAFSLYFDVKTIIAIMLTITNAETAVILMF